jgi:hypothetical protein
MDDANRVDREAVEAVEDLLLRAGRAGAPPGAKERSLAVALIGGTVVASQAAAYGAVGGAGGAAAHGAVAGAGGIAGAAKVGSLTAIHFIAVTALTGVGAVAGAMLVRDADRAAPSPVVQSAAAPSAVQARPQPYGMHPAAPSAVATAVATASEPVASAPPDSKKELPLPTSTPPAVSPPAVESMPIRVRAEVAALDEARHALARGEPARALSILDAYGARFPHGVMAPEATLVRIEALLKAGDRPAAERAATTLAATDPDNPYLARVQSLLASFNR